MSSFRSNEKSMPTHVSDTAIATTTSSSMPKKNEKSGIMKCLAAVGSAVGSVYNARQVRRQDRRGLRQERRDLRRDYREDRRGLQRERCNNRRNAPTSHFKGSPTSSSTDVSSSAIAPSAYNQSLDAPEQLPTYSDATHKNSLTAGTEDTKR